MSECGLMVGQLSYVSWMSLAAAGHVSFEGHAGSKDMWDGFTGIPFRVD